MTAISKIIIRDFTVNPALIGMDAINKAKYHTRHITDSVVASMPRAVSENGQIHFLNVGSKVSVFPTLEAANHGLRPADPHSLIAFNVANPDFANTHRNVTEWIDENGVVCCAAFSRFGYSHYADFCHAVGGWYDRWWFACVSE